MSSLLDPFKNLISNAHRGSTVGVDIGSSSVKLVELEKIDEIIVLKNYGELMLGPRANLSVGQATNLSPEKLAEAVRDLMHEAGIAAHHTVMAIPSGASLLSVVELPDVGEKELVSMVPLEARRYIPVPMSEVSLDWWMLPRREKAAAEGAAADAKDGARGKVEVIMAAIHNDVIKKYQAIGRDAHLPGEASHFEIEMFSTLRAVAGSELDPMLVVDIGAGSVKLALVDGGVLRGSHVMSSGAQEITHALARAQHLSFDEAEHIKCGAGMVGDERGRDVASVADIVLSAALSEAVRFVENYERKYACSVKKVTLAGGGASLKGIVPLVQKHFSKATVVVAHPFDRAKTQAFLAPTLKEIGPRFAVAIGLALKGLEE